jgi:hypothetical protein
MPAYNRKRVLLGALVGGIVWFLWSWVVNDRILGPHYMASTTHFLATPRYGAFLPIWGATCLAMAYVLAWLYAVSRATLGAGPKTALCIGLAVGFLMAFPHNFAMATWSTADRIFPLWWTLESWVGAIAASLLAGWLYKD